MSALHRIIYCSRSRLSGAPARIEAEIARILERSRMNNAAAGLGGALLFSEGCFAQVLEGPLEPLSAAFERIQCDERHAEVALLARERAGERYFPLWTLAYAGAARLARQGLAGRTGLSEAFAQRSAAAGHRILATLGELAGERRVAAL